MPGLNKLLTLYKVYFAPLLPLLAGLYRFRYLNTGLRWLLAFVIFGQLTEIAARMVVIMGYQNIPLMHLYVPVKFILFSMVYRYYLDGFVNRYVIMTVAVLFVLFSVVNSLFIQSIHEYNSYVRAIGALILAVYALLWFMKTLKNLNIPRLRDEPFVWINTGAIFYFSGSFFVFILSKLILAQSVSLMAKAFWISSSLLILFYLLIAVGFWKSKK
ncbi:MAG: hypothetical protein ACOZDD_08100 [Bacteroidota bacterium]